MRGGTRAIRSRSSNGADSSANDGAFGLVITLSPVHEEQDGVIA
jgi:hypothetical protein